MSRELEEDVEEDVEDDAGLLVNAAASFLPYVIGGFGASAVERVKGVAFVASIVVFFGVGNRANSPVVK